MLKIFSGKPDDIQKRSSRELRVYDLLEQLQIAFLRVDHPHADTMQDCQEIDAAFHCTICKNLFLCNRQQTAFYLLMILGEKAFKTKELSTQIGSARLSFAPTDKMLEYLDILPGSVSVMGLMNDHRNQVQLLVDKDLLESEYIGCHPCVNTSSMKIRTADIMNIFLPAVHHDPEIVQLSGE